MGLWDGRLLRVCPAHGGRTRCPSSGEDAHPHPPGDPSPWHSSVNDKRTPKAQEAWETWEAGAPVSGTGVGVPHESTGESAHCWDGASGDPPPSQNTVPPSRRALEVRLGVTHRSQPACS